MKKTTQLTSLMSAMLVAGSISMAPTVAQAGISANIGAVTQYIFRGTSQGDGAAAQGGIDYEHDSGLYAGVWGSSMNSDTTPGFEYDLYAGWSGSFSQVDLGIGYTSYNYGGKAGGFADYKEVNLSAGYKFLSINYDIGTDSTGTPDKDYKHYAISAEYNNFSATYGATKYDASGSDTLDYMSLGYSHELAKGLDGNIELINSGKHNDNTVYMVLGLTKSF